MLTEGGGNLGQNKYTISLFLFQEKVTFTLTFQENTVFTFTSLLLKGHNLKSSLRD